MLTYFGKWDFVESDIDYEMARRLYIAPGEYDKNNCICMCTCKLCWLLVSESRAWFVVVAS